MIKTIRKWSFFRSMFVNLLSVMFNVPTMKKNSVALSILFILISLPILVQAQFGEPKIQEIIKPKNLYDEGYKKGFGFSFNLNDFGFGAGMQYRIGLGPYSEGLINFKIAGLRDPREQTHIDIYFGNRTIASKYQRIITFPTTIGYKRRVFASQVTDNFRIHTAFNLGPSFALSIPYFRDFNGNGYREDDYARFGLNGVEPINDIFQGWKDAKSEFGWTGEFLLGIDFGENFGRLQTLQFGYNFYYFNKGLQILEPKSAVFDSQGNGYLVDANDKVNYFGSAQITFIIGWMYN